MSEPEGASGDLTRGPLAGKTLGFGIPLALAMMGHGLFNLVDLVIVGRLDEGSIAAVTIAGIVLTLAMLLFDGVSNVTVALTAHAHGARHPRMVRDVAWESLILAVIASLISGVLLYLVAEPLVRRFEIEDEHTVQLAVEYLQVMAMGMVTMLLIMQTTAVLRGVGYSRWPMVILVGSNLLNIVLDIALVFGYWGFPAMGVVGAAWATVLARGLGCVLGLWLIFRRHGAVALLDHPLRRPFRYMRSLLLVGLPTSLQLGARVLSLFFLLLIARDAHEGSGQRFMDGVGICIRLEMIAAFLGLGWGAAAVTVVGQNLGAHEPGRAERGTWLLVVYAAATMQLIGGAIWWWRRELFEGIDPGIPDESLLAGFDYLRITIPYYALLAVAYVLSRALNGATSTKTPMVIDFIALTVMLFLAGALSGAGFLGFFESAERSPSGAWWAAFVVNAVLALVYALVFHYGAWKRKVLAPHPED